MELANRIKAARLAAGLSQKALCGDVVSRNMLSLIESGKARPSMDTLWHFAHSLGKPLSYFLDEDAVVSSNQQRMAQAENAYARKDFMEVLSLLEDYEAPDGVFDNTRYLLEYLACAALAETAVREGKNNYANALLERAESARVNTVYAPGKEQVQVLRYRLDPTCAAALQVDIDEGLLIRAEAALLENRAAAAVKYLDAIENLSARGHLLRGRAALLLEDFNTAKAQLLSAESQYAKEAIPLLEQAFLALGDYKSAYEYAKKH